ncbi:hypothetical protein ABTJ50_21320, partial [Acinetobacter baumannii]
KAPATPELLPTPNEFIDGEAISPAGAFNVIDAPLPEALEVFRLPITNNKCDALIEIALLPLMPAEPDAFNRTFAAFMLKFPCKLM